MSDTLTHWTRILADAWGIRARLTPLHGELDLNFHAAASDGRAYILKVMRADCDPALADLLPAAHAHVRSRDPSLPVPDVVPLPGGAPSIRCPDPEGRNRVVWLLSHLDGTTWATFRPHSLSLLTLLGQLAARLDQALTDFRHPALARELSWDLRRADWIEPHVDRIQPPPPDGRSLLRQVLARYRAVVPLLRARPAVPIHNDLNDHNLLVGRAPTGEARVTGLLDFGDLIAAPRVCELAIAGAYAVLDHDHPGRALAALVEGYHAVAPLEPAEVDLIWPLLLTRLAVSVVNAALVRNERPGDPYAVISEEPAWRFLERAQRVAEPLVTARLRVAAGFPPADTAGRVRIWLDRERGHFAPVLGRDLSSTPVASLSVADSTVPRNPFEFRAEEAAALGPGDGHPAEWLGRYGEPRLAYTAPAFRLGPYPASPRRTVHLAVDVFMPAGTAVHAPLDGTVEVVEFRDRLHDYGGMVILRHETPEGDRFFTLYGHLSRSSVEALAPGQPVPRGHPFAVLGSRQENGGWPPHLHFQLALLTDGLGDDWPGVADPDELALWRAVCPNPAALLNLPDERVEYRPLDVPALRRRRQEHFAANLKLSYARPCLFLRGWRHYLFDEWGRPFLDAYNNVPHVGHAHPRIQAVAADQWLRLNSNTRYLHPAQVEFATALLARLPAGFTHVFLVNSGSEATELALRLARAHTGGTDMIVLDHGYHGWTTGALDLSAYKFTASSGHPPPWVHVIPAPDVYRGPHRGPDAGERYAAAVDHALAAITARGGRLAGFMAETFPSVAGQIIPPPGYLAAVYARVRAAGGICIADEVQTGLGRLGRHYWAFEQQGVTPDVVVLGKPLGNGHPIGAVVTTAPIARSFDNGVEFFSTFGGSTLSCRVGTEVLRIVDDEGLADHARQVGDYLLAGLRALQERSPVIGDVRGMGLFLGVDLVTDRETRTPATAAAAYVTERLREERILIGTEGPAANVLKIRPPLTFGAEDADMLLTTLDRVLAETVFLTPARGPGSHPQ
jgi:4-aminobutyrate aminotransferase-like enzyme/Ser/Thr protein kinase RdoA (MazF antagonist)/murein DD-endopeptidase MepM/ murein hydrolase activator NlpD